MTDLAFASPAELAVFLKFAQLRGPYIYDYSTNSPSAIALSTRLECRSRGGAGDHGDGSASETAPVVEKSRVMCFIEITAARLAEGACSLLPC